MIGRWQGQGTKAFRLGQQVVVAFPQPLHILEGGQAIFPRHAVIGAGHHVEQGHALQGQPGQKTLRQPAQQRQVQHIGIGGQAGFVQRSHQPGGLGDPDQRHARHPARNVITEVEAGDYGCRFYFPEQGDLVPHLLLDFCQ